MKDSEPTFPTAEPPVSVHEQQTGSATPEPTVLEAIARALLRRG